MHEDLAFHSLSELSALLSSRRTSSREIVDTCLSRIAALDSHLHAFVDVYADTARALAQAADLERAQGVVRSPLHGLPIALKDLLHLTGRQTTAGSRSWLGRVSTCTATVVVRLLAAGMIPLGKTHMVEFAFGGWGRNAPMGAPWNPWDTATHRVAGGSSSGSAVAVAAGLAPAAIGSDTGGSIRIPAGLCSLTGLKTTYGLVSLANVVPLSFTLDSVGPIARTAEDAARLTAVMAGPDPLDRSTLSAPRFDLDSALANDANLAGRRITVMPPGQFGVDVAAEVLRARDDAIAALRDLGAKVDEAQVPFDFDDIAARNGRIIAAEAYGVHRAYIEDASLPIDPWVRKRMVAGKAIGAADYIDEIARAREAAARFTRWMQERDALLTPTLPITATAVADVDESTAPLAAFTRAANYLGACALSLPAGFAAPGLPVAVQLIGAPFTEATLLRIGRAFQAHTDWHRRRPDLSAW